MSETAQSAATPKASDGQAKTSFEISQGLATVLVAVIGFIGVAIGHIATSWTSRDVAEKNALATANLALENAKANAQLEQQRFVQTTISAVIGKGTEQEQIRALRFYAKIGVIGEPYATKILKLPDTELPLITAVPTTASARDLFFKKYRATLGRLSEDGEVALTMIFGFIQTDNLTDVRQVAYILATVQHETNGSFKPITERGSDDSFEQRYGAASARASQFDNTEPGDGARYRGRGYVQLVGKVNYRKVGEALGIDLVQAPEKILEPETAYRALAYAMKTGLFTGRRLDEFVSGENADYVNARRVVNALARASEIADAAKKFESILREVLASAGGR